MFSFSKAEATEMIDIVQKHSKFFTDTPADKNPAEINGSAPKNFHRKTWFQQSGWQGRKTSKIFSCKYQGKEAHSIQH